jgi:hypothetical protein
MTLCVDVVEATPNHPLGSGLVYARGHSAASGTPGLVLVGSRYPLGTRHAPPSAWRWGGTLVLPSSYDRMDDGSRPYTTRNGVSLNDV